MPKAKPRPTRGMGIIADPYRGPVKKRGAKRPARPGWGQALLGRSRRGWSHGGTLFHAWPGPAKNRERGRRRVLGSLSQPTTRAERPLPGSGGWSVGGALNKKRKGYQQGRALTPRAVKSAWGLNRPGNAAAMVRSMSIPGRERSFARMQAGEIPHFGPSSGGSVKTPPGGWNRGGPAKFRDDQSLGIRGGKVRKPVGYNSGGILEKVPVKKKKKVHPASVGGRGKRVRIKRVPSKRDKAKQKYLSKGRGG